MIGASFSLVVMLSVWGRLAPIIVDASAAVPSTVNAGDMIEIERQVRVTRGDCFAGEVNAQLVDSHKVIRPLDRVQARNAPVSGTSGSKWMVPDTMPPGASTYRATISYDCFPFFGVWPVSVVMPEVYFWVRENGAHPRFGSVD